jgi:Cft2 family RNA processing exonuclease
MRFINLTRRTEIGANSYFLELEGRKVVVDAGLHPKEEGDVALPAYRLVPDGSLEAIIISHAHQDHVGSLPVLMRRQPQATVLMTHATSKLSDIMLHNSVNVMSRQRDELGLRGYPLFTHREADQAAELWQSVGLRQYWTLSGERLPKPQGEPTFEMYDSGHILGSAGILFRAEGRNIFYTGDVNFLEQTLMRSADFPDEEIDVLIIETTRGDRSLDPTYSRTNEEQRFLTALDEAFEQGGSVLIPVFALGKTQEILAMLYRFKRRGFLKETPIYIGGLSKKITVAHDQLASSTTRQHPGLQLLDSIEPHVLSGREIATTQVNRRRIYALSSGMMTEKTLSNQLAERIIGDPRQSIFFVGYADPDSPGGRLKAAQRGDQIQLDGQLPSRRLACSVKEFDFSAHAPREMLFEYIRKVAPRIAVLVHGDPPAVGWFADRIASELPATQAIIPEAGREYEF